MELRERPVCRTALPKELNEWAEERGLFLSLINKSDDVLSQQSFYERYAVEFEELPPELKAHLKRLRAFDTKTGYLQRGDTFLCAQPLAARAHLELESEHRRMAMESSEAYKDLASDIVQQIAGDKGHVAEQAVIPNASEHILGGMSSLPPDQQTVLRRAMQAAAKARGDG